MTHATSQHIPDQGPATVRALHSLTARDRDALRAAVRGAGGLWTVLEHEDYEGYLSFLVTPERDGAPGYMISGRRGAVELAAVAEDDVAMLGTFASIGALVAVLKIYLGAASWAANPAGAAPVRPVAERQAEREAERLCERHGRDAAVQAAMRADAAVGRDGQARWQTVLRAIDGLKAG